MKINEETELNILRLRKEFYGDRSVAKRLKQLEDKYVRDKEAGVSKEADQGNIPKDK